MLKLQTRFQVKLRKGKFVINKTLPGHFAPLKLVDRSF